MTSIALSLFTDNIYLVNDAYIWQSPAQSVRTIMRHGIGCNIVKIANQLSFTYRDIAPKLRVYISPSIETTKTSDFIYALKNKQNVWCEIMTSPNLFKNFINTFISWTFLIRFFVIIKLLEKSLRSLDKR